MSLVWGLPAALPLDYYVVHLGGEIQITIQRYRSTTGQLFKSIDSLLVARKNVRLSEQQLCCLIWSKKALFDGWSECMAGLSIVLSNNPSLSLRFHRNGALSWSSAEQSTEKEGAGEQRSREQESRGAEEKRSRGAEEQRAGEQRRRGAGEQGRRT